jgi:proton-dependent oligopeptide transporter, POT family
MGTAQSIQTYSGERAFLGHPKGLFYLAFTEAWERFSYYGMTALLVLYMVNQLLLPGHVQNIAGFGGFRSAIESLVGPQSPQALASRIFGLYSGFVYFTPMLGGLIADRWIGQRNAVVIGALLMSAGHIAMAFERSLLAALLLLVTGSGFLKGNISAQVGSLYRRDDEARRTRGFTIFSTGINVGAVTGPLVCGLLAQVYGWHYGFGVAGLFMLAGLATYLYGYRYLPARVVSNQRETGNLTAREWYATLAVIAVIGITICQSVSQYQEFNVFPVWIQQHVARQVSGYAIPIPWFFSLESLTSIMVAPLLFLLWRWQALRRREPGDLSKIGIGAGLAVVTNLILVVGILGSGNGRVHPIWPALYCVGTGISFMYYWPTTLALVSRATPAQVNATMMGIAFMSLFVANNLIGWIGGFYERMSPIEFWALHAAIAATGGLIVLLLGRRLGRVLSAREQQP